MKKWTEEDYRRVYADAFSPFYPGYRPSVVELPNGDGKPDVQKRFSHLALKYGVEKFPVLEAAFWRGMYEAQKAVPYADLDPAACALRVLEYPPGAGSELHTDFGLFTVNLWRSHPELMRPGGPDVHFGELWPIMRKTCTEATPHYVEPHPTETQYSLVFFAIPAHETVLPSGQTVGEWLAERIARSRSYR